MKFDYETPNRALGIPATAVVDGINEWQRTSVFVERRFDGERRWDWHWLAGLGVAKVDTIGNVAGTRADGGTFDIATVADDELHMFAGAGFHRPLGQRWLLDTSLTIEHHDTDYQLTDSVSGATRHDRLAVGLWHLYRRELRVLSRYSAGSMRSSTPGF